MNNKNRTSAMNRKINQSSLGTTAARKLRARTPPAVTKTIVTRSSERSAKREK